MNSDDQMDDLLRDAGGRWRATNPGTTHDVDFDALAPVSGARSWRTRWLVIASAAAVVAAVAIGGTWLGTHQTHDANTGAAGPGDGAAEPTTWGGLTGTEWSIFDVTTETSTSSDTLGADQSTASLHIHSDGSFTGSDGCNSMSGTARITATQLTFGPVSIPAIGCVDSNVNKVAAAVDAILQGSVTWIIGNAGGANDLSIEHAGIGSIIYFGARPPSPPVLDPTKMAGTWQLVEYDQTSEGGGSGGSADGSGSATGSGSSNGFGDLLVIDADGTFKVQHRCYADSGEVSIDTGTAVWIGVHLDGSIPCPAIADQKDEQDRTALVDSILTGATTWKIDSSGQLRITKGGNTIVYAPYVSDDEGGAATSSSEAAPPPDGAVSTPSGAGFSSGAAGSESGSGPAS
jgi:heat shock protein HslJ